MMTQAAVRSVRSAANSTSVPETEWRKRLGKRKDERCDQQHAGAVAEPVNQPGRGQSGIRLHAGGVKREHSYRRADDGAAKRPQDDQPERVAQSRQRRIEVEDSAEERTRR